MDWLKIDWSGPLTSAEYEWDRDRRQLPFDGVTPPGYHWLAWESTWELVPDEPGP